MTDASYYRAQAEKCRHLAKATTDKPTIDNLLMLAREYEEEARKFDGGSDAEPTIPTFE